MTDELSGNIASSSGVEDIVMPNGSSDAANVTCLPQIRKPLRVIVLIIVYPFVIVGLLWFVVTSFPGEPFQDAALVIALVIGNIFMNGLLIYHRHKTRDRWIKAEASKWLRSRLRESSAHGSVLRRKVQHAMLWLPSTCALLVLVFLPLASHIIFHPSSRYLPTYRVPIPWTWTAVSACVGENCWADAVISSKGIGRFGVTPFWHDVPLSMVQFGTIRPDNYDWKPEGLGVSKLTKVEMVLGNTPLSCWQFLLQYDLYDRQLVGLPADVLAWYVVCGNRTFYANFFGLEKDLPAFYNVLRHVTPTN